MSEETKYKRIDLANRFPDLLAMLILLSMEGDTVKLYQETFYETDFCTIDIKRKMSCGCFMRLVHVESFELLDSSRDKERALPLIARMLKDKFEAEAYCHSVCCNKIKREGAQI